MPTPRKRPGRPKGSGTIGGARFTVRLPPLLMARLDAYCQGTHAGLSPLRMTDVVRVALEHYFTCGAGPGNAGSGPVEAPTTRGEVHGADQSHMGEDHTDQKAAPSQDHKRTTGRTGGKRTTAAKE